MAASVAEREMIRLPFWSVFFFGRQYGPLQHPVEGHHLPEQFLP